MATTIEIFEQDRAVLLVLVERGDLVKLTTATLTMMAEAGLDALSFVTKDGAKIAITVSEDDSDA